MHALNYVILSSHVTLTPGMMDKLRAFLKSTGAQSIQVLHPLLDEAGVMSSFTAPEFERKTKIARKWQFLFEGIWGAISVLKWRWQSRQFQRIPLAICFDALSFFNIYLFSWIYRVDTIVFYNLDYSAQRYSQPVFNFLYTALNRLAYRFCDQFWYATPDFMSNLDPKGKYAYKTSYVRHSVPIRSIDRSLKRRENTFVYCGSLEKTVDFKPLFTALQKLKSRGIEFHLDMFGTGKSLPKWKRLSHSLGIQSHITWKGVVENQLLVTKLLPQYSFGVAPYILPGTEGAPDHMFHGVDVTSKLVEYFAAGLPCLTPKISDAFTCVEMEKIGIFAATPEEWESALTLFLTRPKLLEQYQKRARAFSLQYDEKKIWLPLLQKILKRRVH